MWMACRNSTTVGREPMLVLALLLIRMRSVPVAYDRLGDFRRAYRYANNASAIANPLRTDSLVVACQSCGSCAGKTHERRVCPTGSMFSICGWASSHIGLRIRDNGAQTCP